MNDSIFLKAEIKSGKNTASLDKDQGRKKCIDLAFRKRKSLCQNSNSKCTYYSTKNTQYEDIGQVVMLRGRQNFKNIDRVSPHIKKRSVDHRKKMRSHVSDSHQPLLVRAMMTNYKIEEKDKPYRRLITQPQSQLPMRPLSNKKIVSTAKQSLKVYDKHLQLWINSVIQQYSIEETFDRNIPLCALKKYRMDKNALLTQGLDHDDVNQIYKALYIYSQGFSSMIKDIKTKSPSMYRVLWRIYSILLQHFSEGQFKALIAQLQRESNKKMEVYTTKLQANEQIINKNEQINKQRNFQVLKELKNLKEQNLSLNINNSVLLEDIYNSDLAFKDQVSLRMNFQNKISQVHALYSQMAIKHNFLFEDFNLQSQQLKITKDKICQLREYNISVKKQNIILKQDIQLIKESINILRNQKLQLQQLYKQKSDLQLQLKIKQQYQIKIIKELQANINQQKYKLSNAELVIDLHRKNQQALRIENSQMLSKNANLQKIIAKQQASIDSFIHQKKADIKDNELQLQLQSIKQKLNSKQNFCSNLKAQIQSITGKLQLKQHQYQQISLQNQQLIQNLKFNNQKIQEMKRINNQLETELITLRHNVQKYKIQSSQIQSNTKDNQKDIDILKANILQLINVIKQHQSDISILTLKLQYQQQFKNTQLIKIQQKSRLSQIAAGLAKQQCEKYADQRNMIRIAYDQIWAKYKNQQFQRNNLQLRYKHSLIVVQSQNNHTKQLNRIASTLKEQLQQRTRKIKGLQNRISHKQKQYAALKNLSSIKIKQQKDEIYRNACYVHPMIYQDTLATCCRSELKMLQVQDQMIQQKKTFYDKYYQMEQNLKITQGKIKTDSQSFTKQINKKQLQNQYYKKKSQELQVTVDNLELSVQVLKNTQKEEKSYTLSHQQQKRYLQIIKQKTVQINQLLQSVQKIQDKNRQLIIRIQTQKQLKKHQQNIQQAQVDKNSSVHDKTAHFLQKSALSWMSKEQQERLSLRLRQSSISLEQMAEMIQQSILRGSIRKSNHPREMSPTRRADIQQSELWISDQIHESARHTGDKKQTKLQKKGFQKPGWRKDLGNKIKNASNFYKK